MGYLTSGCVFLLGLSFLHIDGFWAVLTILVWQGSILIFRSLYGLSSGIPGYGIHSGEVGRISLYLFKTFLRRFNLIFTIIDLRFIIYERNESLTSKRKLERHEVRLPPQFSLHLDGSLDVPAS